MALADNIERALKNQGILVSKSSTELDDRYYGGPVDSAIEYWIAPPEGLYTAKELQSFMIGTRHDILSDFRLSYLGRFIQTPHRLEFGTLHFDETNGEHRTRIILRFYPDRAFAQDVVEGRHSKYEVDPADLKRYKLQSP